MAVDGTLIGPTIPSAVLHTISRVSVAPIASTIKGLSTEVLVGERNGLDHDSAASLDRITTVLTTDVGRWVGYLHDEQEHDPPRRS